MKLMLKNFITFLFALTVMFSIQIFAFADPFSIAVGGLSGASGAGLFGAMAGASGVDIGYGSSDPVTLWNDVTSDEYLISGYTHKGDGTASDPYDYIVIEQTGYDSIQQGVIDEFIADWNLVDNETRTITTPRSYHGYPLYSDNESYKSPSLGSFNVGTFNLGSAQLRVEYNTTLHNYQGSAYFNGNYINTSSATDAQLNHPVVITQRGSQYLPVWRIAMGGGEVTVMPSTGIQLADITPAGNFSILTQDIDTDYAQDYSGTKLRIPSNSSLSSNFTAQDFLTLISSIYQAGQASTIVIEDAYEPVPPVPPSPIPSTQLGQVPFSEWVDDWGSQVTDGLSDANSSLDSIDTNIGQGVDTLDNIDTNIQTGVDILDNIDTNIDAGTEALESIDTNVATQTGILGQIRDWMQSGFNTINTTLNSILSGVQSLVQSIVNATENLIAGILNQIPIAFQTAWNTIKQHVSIWHYVVEWVTSITSPLTWIWGVASGTSYYIILPVYASLAGAVVLALYKKFGR